MAVTRADPGRRRRHEGLRAVVWDTRKWGCAVTAPSPRLAVNGTEKWQALRFHFKALLACLCTEGTPAAGKGRQMLLERGRSGGGPLCRRDVAHLLPVCGMHKQRLHTSFPNRISLLPGVGWPQRSQGWPGLRPWCPSLSAPHPRPCLLPALMVDVPMRSGQVLESTSCWFFDSTLGTDRDGVCPASTHQDPLCSQPMGMLTLP